MRVVIVGAILASARHTMAAPAALMEKLMGKAFMPAVATPQGGSHMSVHTEALVAPGDRTLVANFPESDPGKEKNHFPWEVFKLDEAHHRMKTEREGFRSQIAVMSQLTHAQTMPIDAHRGTLISGLGGLGYGIGAVLLLSIIHKFYSEWNHRTPVISTRSMDGATLQSSAATALPLLSSTGGLRTLGVVMSESEGPGGREAMHVPEPIQAGSRSRDVKMQYVSYFRRAEKWPIKVVDEPDSSRYMSPTFGQAVSRDMGGTDDGFMQTTSFADNEPDSSRYMSPPHGRAADRVMASPYRRAEKWPMKVVDEPDSSRYYADILSAPRRTDDGFIPSIREQGRSLRTWCFRSPNLEQVQVMLSTDGRPLDASIELWTGPNSTPTEMRVCAKDGKLTPFNAMIKTPIGPNTVAIRNSNQSEFPLAADVVENNFAGPSPECLSSAEAISGGALRTFPVDQTVDCVQVFLSTNGRPLNAKIEHLQGTSNDQQVIEVFTDDGLKLPFFANFLTPGSDNVVRITNTANIPLIASVVPKQQNVRHQSFFPQR